MPVATRGGSSPSLSNDADRIKSVAGRHVLGGDDHLLEHADEAVDVVQPVVLDVEAWPPNREPWENSTPCAPGSGRSTCGTDHEGAAADDRPPAPRGPRRGWGSRRTGSAGADSWGRCATKISRAERSSSGNAIVRSGLGVPEVHQLADLLGMLGGEVVQLRAVDVGVVELPLVVVEVGPAAERRMGGHGLPAVVPDAPRPEHREELRLSRARVHRRRRSCSACSRRRNGSGCIP